MKKYMKPMFFATEFDLNETIAGCEKVVTGTSTTKVYEKQTVYCEIGSQNETVFNSASGCSTQASKYAVVEYNNKDYFVWFTYAGDTSGSAPSASDVAMLDKLVVLAGFSAGSGWHYAEVTGTDIITDILGFSY